MERFDCNAHNLRDALAHYGFRSVDGSYPTGKTIFLGSERLGHFTSGDAWPLVRMAAELHGDTPPEGSIGRPLSSSVATTLQAHFGIGDAPLALSNVETA